MRSCTKGRLSLHMDALSRMFEGNTEIPLVAVVETDGLLETKDSWYHRHFREISERPKAFSDWRVVDGQLYYRKARAAIFAVIEDLD